MKVILINLGNEKFTVENDSRIAQIVICPVVNIQLEEVKELSETIRGQGGFGSTEFKMRISNNDLKKFSKQIILKKIELLVKNEYFLQKC